MAECDQLLSLHQLRHENQQLIERNASLEELLCDAEETTKKNVSEIDDLKRKNSKLLNQLDEWSCQISDLQKDIDSYKNQVLNVQRDYNALLQEKSSVEAELGQIKEQNALLNQSNSVMESDIKKKESAISELQTSLYEKQISISELEEQNAILSSNLEQRESEITELSNLIRNYEEKLEILEDEKVTYKSKIRQYGSELMKSRFVKTLSNSNPDVSRITDSDLDLVECLITPNRSLSPILYESHHPVGGSVPLVSAVGDVNLSTERIKSNRYSFAPKSLKTEIQEITDFSYSPQICGHTSRKLSLEDSRQQFKLSKSNHNEQYDTKSLDDDAVTASRRVPCAASPDLVTTRNRPVAESTPNLNNLKKFPFKKRLNLRCKTFDIFSESRESLDKTNNNNSWPSTPRRVKSESVDSENNSLKEEFERIVISMRSNFETIEQRFKVHRSSKEIAERNVRNEMTVIDTLLTNFRSCPGYPLELVSKLSTSIEILQNCIRTLSYKSEQLGAVEQEERLNKAFKTMLLYVERLKMLHESSKKENEDIKAKFGEGNGPSSGTSSLGKHKRSYSLFIPSGKGQHQSLLQAIPSKASSQHQDIDSFITFASPVNLPSVPENFSGDNEAIYQKGLKHGLRLKAETDLTRLREDQEKFVENLDELMGDIDDCKKEIVPTDKHTNIKSKVESFLTSIVMEFQPYWNRASYQIRRSLAFLISLFAFLILFFAVLLPIYRNNAVVSYSRPVAPSTPV